MVHGDRSTGSVVSVKPCAINPYAECGAAIPAHRLDVPDVWFVQSGNAIVTLQGTTTIVGPGDTITFPRHEPRCMRNAGAEPVRMVAVRGGDIEAPLLWS